eukprot:2183389-Pyramimonas_sp.AAC.1
MPKLFSSTTLRPAGNPNRHAHQRLETTRSAGILSRRHNLDERRISAPQVGIYSEAKRHLRTTPARLYLTCNADEDEPTAGTDGHAHGVRQLVNALKHGRARLVVQHDALGLRAAFQGATALCRGARGLGTTRLHDEAQHRDSISLVFTRAV